MKNVNDLSLFSGEKPAVLQGIVSRIIFHNRENGFTVLKLEEVLAGEGKKQKKLHDAQAAVGRMLAPVVGMRLKLSGKWVNNEKFGRQLAFDAFEEIVPTEETDLVNYLASGVIKGVGPVLAQRIVDAFGKDTLKIMDENLEELIKIRGISEKMLEGVRKSWEAAKSMRELMLFLQPHGIGNAYAARIYHAYGGDAKYIVKNNPYRLAMDIRGIGFLTADSIARRLGFEKDHPLRIQAALIYLLQKASEEGHVFLPDTELLALVEKQMEIAPEMALPALGQLEREDRIKIETLDADAGLKGIYLSRYFHCESKTAYYLERLRNSPKSVRFKNIQDLMEEVLDGQPFKLAREQIKAVELSAKAKILVVTGGPGTGKTTIIKTIIQLFARQKAKILLAAPTGRAAKRMSETCGLDAKTIHRLLEYSPKEDRFMRNEDNPLACNLLIVDEASMMDTLLFYYLLKAVPLGATFLLVGDVCQLPSVGAGNVLGDMIVSGAMPVVRLDKIFRQAAESAIVSNAHLINHGSMPVIDNAISKSSEFFFIAKDEPEEAADLIIELFRSRLPNYFGLDPINDIQLLTPMRKGTVGAENMNRRLQEALNPNAFEIRRGERSFRLHDKVMQIRNNYDKDVYNGDMGRISYINAKEKTLTVDYDGLSALYDFDELDELAPAYAISIHKSQGSEYPAVIVPIMMQHYVLLQRNLVYTAVTRAKKLVILVGERKALQIAVRNNDTRKRHTWLAHRLMSHDNL